MCGLINVEFSEKGCPGALKLRKQIRGLLHTSGPKNQVNKGLECFCGLGCKHRKRHCGIEIKVQMTKIYIPVSSLQI